MSNDYQSSVDEMKKLYLNIISKADGFIKYYFPTTK